jgi:hypothetical protein
MVTTIIRKKNPCERSLLTAGHSYISGPSGQFLFSSVSKWGSSFGWWTDQGGPKPKEGKKKRKMEWTVHQ